MDITNTVTATTAIFALGSPPISVCWVGGTGIGKTAEARRLAETLKLQLSYVPIRADDWAGLIIPSTDKTRITFIPSDPLRLAMDTACLVYLDEINRVDQYSRAQLLEVIGERTIGGKSLHPDTRVLATCNPESAEYDTKISDNALKTRMIALPIVSTRATTAAWMKKHHSAEETAWALSAYDLAPELFNAGEVAWPLSPNRRLLSMLVRIRRLGLPQNNEIMTFNLGDRLATPLLLNEKYRKVLHANIIA